MLIPGMNFYKTNESPMSVSDQKAYYINVVPDVLQYVIRDLSEKFS